MPVRNRSNGSVVDGGGVLFARFAEGGCVSDGERGEMWTASENMRLSFIAKGEIEGRVEAEGRCETGKDETRLMKIR